MITRSVCEDFVPNDWIAYYCRKEKRIVHIDEFYDPQIPSRRPDPPPGGWSK